MSGYEEYVNYTTLSCSDEILGLVDRVGHEFDDIDTPVEHNGSLLGLEGFFPGGRHEALEDTLMAAGIPFDRMSGSDEEGNMMLGWYRVFPPGVSFPTGVDNHFIRGSRSAFIRCHSDAENTVDFDVVMRFVQERWPLSREELVDMLYDAVSYTRDPEPLIRIAENSDIWLPRSDDLDDARRLRAECWCCGDPELVLHTMRKLVDRGADPDPFAGVLVPFLPNPLFRRHPDKCARVVEMLGPGSLESILENITGDTPEDEHLRDLVGAALERADLLTAIARP